MNKDNAFEFFFRIFVEGEVLESFLAVASGEAEVFFWNG